MIHDSLNLHSVLFSCVLFSLLLYLLHCFIHKVGNVLSLEDVSENHLLGNKNINNRSGQKINKLMKYDVIGHFMKKK